MPDGFREFEAVLGALSKMTSDETRDEGLLDARCPKCEGSSFIKITDLYDEARARAEDPDLPAVPRIAGLSDAQILRRFGPPQRRSPAIRILFAAAVLGVIVYFVYRFFGSTPAQLAGAGAAAVLVGVGLTTIRSVGDDHYKKRKQWRKLYMCRNCGQLVSG